MKRTYINLFNYVIFVYTYYIIKKWLLNWKSSEYIFVFVVFF